MLIFFHSCYRQNLRRERKQKQTSYYSDPAQNTFGHLKTISCHCVSSSQNALCVSVKFGDGTARNGTRMRQNEAQFSCSCVISITELRFHFGLVHSSQYSMRSWRCFGGVGRNRKRPKPRENRGFLKSRFSRSPRGSAPQLRLCSTQGTL